MDDSETALGITVYLGSHGGFSAVSKARYSDFVVHEIGADGRIACLTSLESHTVKEETRYDGDEQDDRKRRRNDKEESKEVDDAPPPRPKKRPEESNDPELIPSPPRSLATVSWEELSLGLESLLGDGKGKEVIEFLRSVEEGTAVEEGITFITVDSVSDKDKRREIHQWVKEQLGFCASSDTADGIMRIWHNRYRARMPNRLDNARRGGGNKNSRPGPRPVGQLMRFVLYKENMDTGSAMQTLTRQLGRQVRLGYAGNKDKRGITAQFISALVKDPDAIYRCAAAQEARGNQSGGGHTRSAGTSMMRIGHVETTTDEIRLGTLRGNRFDIALRNVIATDPATAMTEAVASIKATGFINYFGMQRFGKFCDTHKTGMAALRGDYQGAIDIIMCPKDGERDDTNRARSIWSNRFQDNPADRAAAERRCAKQALKLIGRFMHSESSILKSLAQKPLDYKRAFDSITKTMKMMFMHAIQSILWNKVASFRIEKFGRAVVKGDLVLDDPTNENVVRNRAPEVKTVTEEDVAASRYSLEDIVLPLIGADTRDPDNGCSQAFDEALKADDVSRDRLINVRDRDLHCVGDYRKLICRPTDIDYEILRYSDELQPLIETDYMKINGIAIDPCNHEAPLWGMRVGFSLPSSSYATIFLRELMKKPTSSSYQRTLGLGNESETPTSADAGST